MKAEGERDVDNVKEHSDRIGLYQGISSYCSHMRVTGENQIKLISASTLGGINYCGAQAREEL